MKFVVTQKVVDSLYEAGILTDSDRSVRRVVIDLKIGEPAVMFVERFLDDEELRIVERGIEIVPTAEAAGISTGRPKT